MAFTAPHERSLRFRITSFVPLNHKAERTEPKVRLLRCEQGMGRVLGGRPAVNLAAMAGVCALALASLLACTGDKPRKEVPAAPKSAAESPSPPPIPVDTVQDTPQPPPARLPVDLVGSISRFERAELRPNPSGTGPWGLQDVPFELQHDALKQLMEAFALPQAPAAECPRCEPAFSLHLWSQGEPAGRLELLCANTPDVHLLKEPAQERCWHLPHAPKVLEVLERHAPAPPSSRSSVQTQPDDSAALAQSVNKASLRLLQTLPNTDTGAFISPAALAVTFAALQQGAEGVVGQQLRAVSGLKGTSPRLDNLLMASLEGSRGALPGLVSIRMRLSAPDAIDAGWLARVKAAYGVGFVVEEANNDGQTPKDGAQIEVMSALTLEMGKKKGDSGLGGWSMEAYEDASGRFEVLLMSAGESKAFKKRFDALNMATIASLMKAIKPSTSPKPALTLGWEGAIDVAGALNRLKPSSFDLSQTPLPAIYGQDGGVTAALMHPVTLKLTSAGAKSPKGPMFVCVRDPQSGIFLALGVYKGPRG